MVAVTNKERKADTRGRLLDAAAELFEQFGYDNSTLEAVAERAGLHVQTLYRHFPCKPDLATELWHRSLNDFEVYFSVRKKKTIPTWRDWVALNVRKSSDTISGLAGSNGPPVSGRVLEYWERYQQVLAEGLAEDMGIDDPSDLRPMLIACMLWGANQKVAVSWGNKRWDEEKIIASLMAVVDTVEALFHEVLTVED